MQFPDTAFWNSCMELFQKKSFKQLVDVLEPLDCAIANYFKGKLHVDLAERIINSHEFRYYPSKELKQDVHQLFMKSYKYYFDASLKKDQEFLRNKDLFEQELILALENLDLLVCEHQDPTIQTYY